MSTSEIMDRAGTMNANRHHIWAWTGLMLLTGLLATAHNSSATVISDIPEGVNEALFDGGNLFGAQLLLSVSILFSAGLALAVCKFNVIGTVIVLICVLALLVAIGWADVWLFVVACLVVGAMFTRQVITFLTGSSQSGGD